jgi:hypothetical protein
MARTVEGQWSGKLKGMAKSAREASCRQGRPGVYTRPVDSSRQRAWLMLAMMVLWIAMPVSVCVRAMQPTGQHMCCHDMTQTCNSSGMSANGSCCRVQPQNPAITAVFSYFSDHSQQFVFLSHPARLPAVALSSARFQRLFGLPPSILSSANASILRI